jgi:hypothetical protein
MKKILPITLTVLSLSSTSYGYGFADEVSNESFPPPVIELA